MPDYTKMSNAGLANAVEVGIPDAIAESGRRLRDPDLYAKHAEASVASEVIRGLTQFRDDLAASKGAGDE